ncbi:MAG: hypothetical protein ABSG15_09250 [FCB group bacterium]
MKNINELIIQLIANLNSNQQVKLLGFIESITGDFVFNPKNILKFAGSISPKDLKLMQQAIEEDCERIDYNGW